MLIWFGSLQRGCLRCGLCVGGGCGGYGSVVGLHMVACLIDLVVVLIICGCILVD